jgi:hypothetical protein
MLKEKKNRKERKKVGKVYTVARNQVLQHATALRPAAGAGVSPS